MSRYLVIGSGAVALVFGVAYIAFPSISGFGSTSSYVVGGAILALGCASLIAGFAKRG
jgi:uncharacterized membrane protein HdeD (DUF308 family)